MKKLKLSASKANEIILSREQLKQVLGGQTGAGGSDGDCQGQHAYCDTYRMINCCSFLVCADYKCYIGTI